MPDAREKALFDLIEALCYQVDRESTNAAEASSILRFIESIDATIYEKDEIVENLNTIKAYIDKSAKDEYSEELDKIETVKNTADYMLKSLKDGKDLKAVSEMAKELKKNLGLNYFNMLNNELDKQGGIICTSNCENLVSTSDITKITNYKVPEIFIENNTKACNKLFALGNEEFLEYAYSESGAKVSNINGGKGVTTIKLINPSGKKEDEVASFDSSVHDAVCSIINSGVTEFDISLVIRLVYPDSETGKAKITKARIEEIRTSLEKMSITRTIIDFSDHLKYIKSSNMDSDIIPISGRTYLLPLKSVVILHPNKCVTEGYKVIDKPPLFEYSTRVNQNLKYENNLISCGSLGVPRNRGIMLLRRALLKRIIVYSHKNCSNYDTILCSNIYDIYSEKKNSDPSKAEKKRIREHAEQAFKEWSKVGIMKGYSVIKKDRSIYSYKLKIN